MNLLAAETTRVELPRPVADGLKDVVIYDGHCRFCTAQVRRLRQLDRGGRLTFLSLHDPEVTSRFPDLTYDDMMQAMYVVDPQGRKHRGAEAIRYLTRRLPLLYGLAPLLHIPGSLGLWHWLYRQVANRRYRFGRVEDCDGGTCHLHFPPRDAGGR